MDLDLLHNVDRAPSVTAKNGTSFVVIGGNGGKYIWK